MRTALIVDDSTVGRMLVSRVLSSSDWHIVEADDGESALRAITTSNLDIVFLDLLMPGMSGIDVLREARAAGARAPIVVLTADTQATTREECLALGAAAVLSKPLSSDELARVLASIQAPSA